MKRFTYLLLLVLTWGIPVHAMGAGGLDQSSRDQIIENMRRCQQDYFKQSMSLDEARMKCKDQKALLCRQLRTFDILPAVGDAGKLPDLSHLGKEEQEDVQSLYDLIIEANKIIASFTSGGFKRSASLPSLLLSRGDYRNND